MSDDASLSLLDARVMQMHLHDTLGASAYADLRRALRPVDLAAGQVLMHQGDPGDDIFLVLSGRLAIEVEHADGTSTRVDEVGPGNVVGEMALLTGQPRTATIRATDTARLACLSRRDFDRLSADHADALKPFLQEVLPRMRSTQLVQLLTELFGRMDPTVLAEIESKLDWVRLRSGTVLFREGDVSDHVYLVVNGRLRVVAAEPDGRERVLEEVGRGSAVGEVALLTGEPRAATVFAVRDTYLLRLSKNAYDELLDRYPRAMMQVARAAVWRLRRAAQPAVNRGSPPTTFALVPASPDVPLAEFARRLSETLRGFSGTRWLTSHDVDRILGKPGIAQTGEETIVHESMVAWLAAQERDRGSLVLQADPEWNAWTRRCVMQADRVLLVAQAGADSAPGAMERAFAHLDLKVRTELVLLHPDDAGRPTGTLAWLDARPVAAHHHVRLGNDRDLRRVARRISDRATGLVLGGGGARGFAHIGVLRALDEAGIEVDMVGGTSIGALISTAVAADIPIARMLELARSFASPKKLLDRTLPITSLMAGRKVTNLFREVFGDLALEDLWTPCFAISSGLSRATAVVHARGPVWRAVRASIALPAIFPPLLADDGEVLVDGGVMNNMPLDVMRGLCGGGTVIGVNPMPTHDKVKNYNFGPSLSGWEALRGRLRLFGSRIRSPGILGSVMRATEINSANRMRQPAFRALADLLIEPAVEAYPILAFDKHAPIIDIGYATARERIAQWQATRAPITEIAPAASEER
jgi:NTE family protein/lysophospholipid hydrolase